jgi:hypothetical protein
MPLRCHRQYRRDSTRHPPRSPPPTTNRAPRFSTMPLPSVQEPDAPRKERRQHPRAKVNYTALVRHPERGDDVVICEDMSRRAALQKQKVLLRTLPHRNRRALRRRPDLYFHSRPDHLRRRNPRRKTFPLWRRLPPTRQTPQSVLARITKSWPIASAHCLLSRASIGAILLRKKKQASALGQISARIAPAFFTLHTIDRRLDELSAFHIDRHRFR